LATLALFRTRVSAKTGLDNTASSAEQVLMDSWINEGVIETLLALKCYVISATMATSVGAADYQLDAGILDIQDILVADVSSQAWSMQHVDPDEILYMRRVTVATSAPPRFYALNGANMLMVYPTPSEVDTFTIYYVPRPTALANPTDDPSTATLGGIPSEYHKLVEWWALSEAGDFADDASAQQGMTYLQKFNAKVKDYRRRQLMKGGRLPRKLPGNSTRAMIGARNDIDTGSWS
jgi:hypothetical protein